MTMRSRKTGLTVCMGWAVAALGIIAVTGNTRLAVLAVAAAAAICVTRIRGAALVAAALLGAVAALSAVAPGAAREHRQRPTPMILRSHEHSAGGSTAEHARRR
jgi:hypothetical protein